MTSGESSQDQGKYEILRAIGRGGMGEVYLARDLRLDRLVAIKYLRSDLQQEKWQPQLRHEAQLLARINHPNIVQIYDVIEHRGVVALVMEYVTGRNLHTQLREKPSDLAELLRWFSEIAAGIAAAHTEGIAHQDLKAENVLIGKDGIAKVTDFGIAKSQTDTSVDILALGTLINTLLAEQSDIPPKLGNFILQLSHKSAAKRPSSSEAALQLRRFWIESTQKETLLPTSNPEKHQSQLKPIFVAGFLLALGAASVASVLWHQGPAEIDYIAVLPTKIRVTSGLGEQQQLNLRSTVEQALQQSVIATTKLSLRSTHDVSQEQGNLTEIALALGVDELVTSSLDCGIKSCTLNLERLASSDLAVLNQRSTSILVDSFLESYSIVQRQWRHLYPQSNIATDASQLITEDTYNEYLELYQSSYIGGSSQTETLARLETLLVSARRFLPLYDLYAHSALEMYDESGNEKYLDKLEAVLTQAETWLGNTIMLRQSQFKLALARKDFDAAAVEIAAIRDLGGDRVLTNQLWGDLYTYKPDYELAHKFLAQALALKPNRALYYSVAVNYYRWGKPEKALLTLNNSLKRYPNDIDALGLIGLILLERGELDAAITRFQQSIAIQPHAIYYSNLGLAYMLKGDYQTAKRLFKDMYDQGNHAPSLILNLADTESLLGNREVANQHYRSLVDRNSSPNSPIKPWILSQSYAQLGLFEQAIATLRLNEKSNSDASATAFNAALVYVLAGQNIAALVEVDRALSADFGPIWFSLPWFDPLCEEPQFSQLLAHANAPNRCAKTKTQRL